MTTTHDYETETVLAAHLDSTHVLVGESGGLSAVYRAGPSFSMPGMMVIETEHGLLYKDPDDEVEVLRDVL